MTTAPSDRLHQAAERLRYLSKSLRGLSDPQEAAIYAALADTMDEIAKMPEWWFRNGVPSLASLTTLILGAVPEETQ